MEKKDSGSKYTKNVKNGIVQGRIQVIIFFFEFFSIFQISNIFGFVFVF